MSGAALRSGPAGRGQFRAAQLRPGQRRRRPHGDHHHALVKQEPFLAYVYETEQFYQVRSGRDLLINIPKNRNFEIPYLKKKPGPAQPAFRWLSLALFALFLGGVGAVLFAPIAAFQALRLQASAPTDGERTRLLIVFILAVVIWLAAIPISWLLLIRFWSS